ncbi:MAG: glycosyltransferase family 4 protein [Deltaproteobacteria bacterium]|nr:glycosyltransferase family 4 protein [Deltaproteobacteria bacterium]MBI3389477.1 glycosyltransferase family 4 protein [Deltaproteobacteria bacterium]
MATTESITRKILFVMPSLQPRGGGRGVAAWMIEALKQEHDLAVLMWEPLDPEPINRYYGTALGHGDFAVLRPPLWWRLVLDRIPFRLNLLRICLLWRRGKQISHSYDLLISTHNEADLGTPGIQYVHFPWVFFAEPEGSLRWYQRSAALLRWYYKRCLRIADFSSERMKRNLTLVNSDWTGSKVYERHGLASTTLYPPVVGGNTQLSWSARENGFVCVGRLSPSKELDRVIDIVAGVRQAGHDVHLHLIGSTTEPPYLDHIRRRVRDNAAWLFLDENPSRAELNQRLAEHRYGIHGMQEEHFGMAIGEMVRAGCVVFVPDGGGQVEIVDRDPRLLYNSVDDAVTKIVATLDDPSRQEALRTHLSSRADVFSVERFIARVRELVRDF